MSVDRGSLDPADPRRARHAEVTLPIETSPLDAAARELAAPPALRQRLAEAMPTLLGPA